MIENLELIAKYYADILRDQNYAREMVLYKRYRKSHVCLLQYHTKEYLEVHSVSHWI